MDVLADVLSTLRLRGQLYFRAELSGHWAVAIPAERATIRFHLVVQGQCWVSVAGNDPVCVREGDFVLVPHGTAQKLSATPDAKAVSLQSLLQSGALGTDQVLRHGDQASGEHCRLVCGYCNFDEGLKHPLFAGLPAILAMGRNLSGSSPWLTEAIRVITMEANLHSFGGSAIMSRLMEVLVIQGIRHQFESGKNPRVPFLQAISDVKLKDAFRAIHEQPDLDWTVLKLAKVCGMSRGRFAKRFKDALDETPMQYLTSWRMQLSRRLLQETDLGIAEIAYRCGYQSLPSFTRRFSKQFAVSPARFRKISSADLQ